MKTLNSDHAATVEAALTVLDLLADSNEALSLSALAKKTGMYKSRVSRLIRSLERRGLAIRVANNGKYLLGPKLISLGKAAQLQLGILTQAQPIMEELVLRSKATAVLRVLDRDEIVAIAIVESPEIVRVCYPVGTRNPFYHGASGKLLSSWVPENVLQHWIARARSKKGGQPATFGAFIRDLKRVRRLGYAFSNESASGIRGVAVPILNSERKVVAALGLGLPKHKFPLKRIGPLVAEAKRAAQKISAALMDQESFVSKAKMEVSLAS